MTTSFTRETKITVNVLPMSHALSWISRGWELLKKKPGYWILFTIALFVFYLITIYSSILWVLGLFTFPAVYKLIDHVHKEGAYFKFGNLLVIFKEKLPDFLFFYLLFFLIYFLPLLLLVVLIPLIFLDATQIGAAYDLFAAADFTVQLDDNMKTFFRDLEATNPGLVFYGALAFFIWLGYTITIAGGLMWFASVLLVLSDITPVQAIKLSMTGILKNIWPLSFYSLLGIFILILSAIPFGLGLFLFFPLGYLSSYYAVIDIYGLQAQQQN